MGIFAPPMPLRGLLQPGILFLWVSFYAQVKGVLWDIGPQAAEASGRGRGHFHSPYHLPVNGFPLKMNMRLLNPFEWRGSCLVLPLVVRLLKPIKTFRSLGSRWGMKTPSTSSHKASKALYPQIGCPFPIERDMRFRQRRNKGRANWAVYPGK